MTARKQRNSYRELKTETQYLKMIAANLVNRFGDSIDAISFSWLMYQITGSASMMALTVGINFLPTVLLQPFAGVLVDRTSKKRVMVLCDIGRGTIVAGVAIALSFGYARAWVLLLMTALNSTLEAFRVPAGMAIVPELLAKEKMTLGNSLNSTLSRVFEIAGMALAGIFLAVVGAAGALYIDAATFFLSSILITWIRVSEQKKEEKASFVVLKQSFFEGFKYLRESRLLKAILLLGMLINAVSLPAMAFITVYVSDILKSGPEMLSAVQIAMTAGIAFGAFLTPKAERFERRQLLVFSGLLVGVGLMVTAATPLMASLLARRIIMLICYAFAGIGIGVVNVVFSVALMQHVDQGFLGRVGGFTNSVLCLMIPVLSFICSGLALLIEIPILVLISGALTVLLFLAISRVQVYREL